MSESGLRTQYQYVIKERDELQAQCDQLTQENLNLRKAVYELSYQLSNQMSSNFFHYDSNTQQFLFKNSCNTSNLASSYSLPRDVLMPPGIEKSIRRDQRTLNFECELKGHSGPIYCVDITSDSRYIASGSFDKTIIIWKGTVPYKQEAILSGHTQLISGVCWGRESLQSQSQSDKKNENVAPVLYSTSFDKTVRIWDTSKAVCLMVIKLKGYGTSLTSCPRNFLYSRGYALVTTATSYFYLIAHPNPGDPSEFDISASLTASERLERQNLLSPVQMTSSSPTTSTPTLRSRSNSDSYVIGASIGNSLSAAVSSAAAPLSATSTTPVTTLPAVYYKHSSGGVPSAVVCLPDGVTLFVGDTSGAVTWYELKNKELTENYHLGNSYVPNMKGKYVIEEGRSNVRVLHMQIAGGPKKELNSLRSNDGISNKFNSNSRYISRLSPSLNSANHSHSSRSTQPTLLALQCSDNTIRLYQLDVGPKLGSNFTPNDTKNDFLIPLRLLREHTTGGQWPIRISFRQGPLFHITTPQSNIIDSNRGFSTLSDSRMGPPSSHSSYLNQTSRQLVRVRATDGLVQSLSSTSLAATSTEDNLPPVSLTQKPVKPIMIPSDDASVASDVSEPVNQMTTSSSSNRVMVRNKLTTEEPDDREGQETESLLSMKGTMSADEEEEEEENFENENGVGDDSGDDENHLNMMAGLATSSLLSSNNFDGIMSNCQQQPSSKLLKNDDLDMLLGGAPTLTKQEYLLKNNQQMVTEWASSFVLATGSNNGQVFLYDLSAISSESTLPLTTIAATTTTTATNTSTAAIATTTTSTSAAEESLVDIDSAGILPAWKILDGHQSTGKAYGAIFTTPQNSATTHSNSSLITFGSDGTIQIWSVMDER